MYHQSDNKCNSGQKEVDALKGDWLWYNHLLYQAGARHVHLVCACRVIQIHKSILQDSLNCLPHFVGFVPLRINRSFFLLHKNTHSFFFSPDSVNTHSVSPQANINCPSSRRSKMDGIISQHSPHPPLPVIVCQSFETLENCLKCIA